MIVVAVAVIAAAIFALLPTTRTNAASCQAPATDYGSATMNVTIPEAATYRIWTRMMTPDTSNNTYLLEVDGQHCFTVGGGVAPSQWTWVAHQNGNMGSKIDLSLTKGNHSLKLIGQKPNVKINTLLFTSDLNCTPTGNGSNCDNPADTTPPTVSLTTPADGSTVNGTVAVSADASDSVGITKVELYVNSSLSDVDTSAPYSFNWNSTLTPNGSQLLTLKAYDAAGNVASDSVRVTVQNGDTQAPSTPQNVSAVANAYNLVTLTWDASTDNNSIKGYRILRNGSLLTEVGAVTSYQDTAVLANTNYAYQVIALDIAGNVSAPSTQASIKTPNVADTQAPSVPTRLSAKVVSASQINLAWKASSDNVGVAGYDIYRGTQKIATVTTTSFGDTGLQPNTKYSYTVRAKDAASNTSAASATVTATTKKTKQRVIVRGTVKDTTNKNLRFALVSAEVSGKRHLSLTNRKGEYALHRLEPGTYNVTYRAFGYNSKSVRTTVTDSTNQVLQTISLQKKSAAKR